MEDINVLLKLNEVYNLLKCQEEKEIIKKLINKRDSPFLINTKLSFSNKEKGRAKVTINKLFNNELTKIFPVNEVFEYNTEFYDYFEVLETDLDKQNDIIVRENRLYGFPSDDRDKWITQTNEYKEAIHIRCQLFLEQKNIFYKNLVELLNIDNSETFKKLILNKLKK